MFTPPEGGRNGPRISSATASVLVMQRTPSTGSTAKNQSGLRLRLVEKNGEEGGNRSNRIDDDLPRHGERREKLPEDREARPGGGLGELRPVDAHDYPSERTRSESLSVSDILTVSTPSRTTMVFAAPVDAESTSR